MGRNVWMCLVSTVSTYIVLEATVYRVEFSHLITQTPVLTALTNNIVYTIHNSMALILCVDHLNMSFNVHITDKVTVSGFLTI